eukprot:4694464-Pyramimonas_sp.AAC.1
MPPNLVKGRPDLDGASPCARAAPAAWLRWQSFGRLRLERLGPGLLRALGDKAHAAAFALAERDVPVQTG